MALNYKDCKAANRVAFQSLLIGANTLEHTPIQYSAMQANVIHNSAGFQRQSSNF